MENNLIVVRQLPVIEDQLQSVRSAIKARVDEILAMECTEDTYKEIKKERSAMNKQFRILEDRRMEVKRQVEAPYLRFDAVYQECVGKIFKDADKQLAEKIRAVEDGIKQQKRDAVCTYFCEYRESLGIDAEMVPFDRAGITVTMSASAKSLKTQAKNFLDRIHDDLDLIDTQEFKHEIMIEYRKSLNASQAIMTVTNRHAAIERQRAAAQQREEAERQRKAAMAAVQKVVEAEPAPEPPVMAPPEPIQMPTIISAPVAEEKVYPSYFCVTATIPKLKALKQFLVDGGYDYANIPAPDSAGS